MDSQSGQCHGQRGRRGRLAVGVVLGVAAWCGGSTVASAADRGFELVSPPDTRGYSVQGLAAQPDGEGFYWQSSAGEQAEEPASDDGGQADVYVARRSAVKHAWEPTWLTTDPADGSLPSGRDGIPAMGSDGYLFMAPGGPGLFFPWSVLYKGTGGALDPVTAVPGSAPVPGFDIANNWGASEDLAATVFSTTADLSPLDTNGRADLYGRRGDSLELISKRTDGSVDGNWMTPWLPQAANIPSGADVDGQLGPSDLSRNGFPASQGASPISRDGRTVIFSTPSSLDPADTDNVDDLYRWRNGATQLISDDERTTAGCPTVAGSTTDCDKAVSYVGMSRDASIVYLRTSDALVDGDTDGGSDLYQYDADAPTGQRLKLATGLGTEPVYAVTVTPNGYLFFVSRDRLGGDPPPGTGPVLYRWDGSGIRTVAAITDADILYFSALTGIAADVPTKRTVRATADGTALVFRTTAALDPADTDGAADLYLWRAGAGVRWISGPGSAPVQLGINDDGPQGGSFTPQIGGGRVISDDGSKVFFTSSDALTPDAGANGRAKLYEWSADGGISLVSPAGVDARAVTYVDNDASGDNVFFMTGDSLVGGDQDGGAFDVYVARTGGGFPEAPVSEPCRDDDCQGPLPIPGSLGPDPGSLSTVGGNVLSDAPKARRATTVKVATPRVARGARGKVRVRVSGAGRITVTGPGVQRATRTARRAGEFNVTVRLTRKASTALRRKGSYRSRLRVRFAPAEGTARQAGTTLRFRVSTSTKGR